MRLSYLQAISRCFAILFFWGGIVSGGAVLAQPTDSVRATHLMARGDTLSQLKEAVSTYLEAAEIWRELDSSVLWRKALIGAARRYNRAGLPDSAISLIFSALGDQSWPPPGIRAATQKSLGYYLDRRARLQEARQVLEEARHYYESQPALTPHDVRYVHKTLGNIYTRLGEYDKAIALLQRAALVFKQHEDWGGYTDARSDLGVVFFVGAQSDSAAQVYEELLALNPPDPDRQLLYRTNLAISLLRIGEPVRAGEVLEAALPQARQSRLTTYVAGYWNASLEYATLNGDTTQARLATEVILQLAEKDSLYQQSREFAKFRVRLGQQQLEEGLPREALEQFHAALAPFLYPFDPKSPEKAPEASSLYAENTLMEALAGKGRCAMALWEQTGDSIWLGRGLSFYERAIVVEQALRKQYRYESSGLALGEAVYRLHREALDCAWAYHHAGGKDAVIRAFRIAEDNRAATLSLSLKRNRLSTAQTDPEWKERESTLRWAVTRARQNLFEARMSGATRDSLEILNLKLFEHTEAYTAHLETIPTASPQDYTPPALDLDLLSERLRQNQEHLISFFDAGSFFYAFSVEGRNLSWSRVSNGQKERKWWDQVFAQLRGSEFDCPVFAQAAHRLYQSWLQPLLGTNPPSKLIIIGDGRLNYLPFEVLLVSRDADTGRCDFRSLPWLWTRTRIRYQYAAHFLLSEQRRSVFASPEVGTFAPFYSDKEKAKEGSMAARSEHFGPLVFNAIEAKAIASTWEGDFFGRGEANRRRFLASAENYDLLHLAMHAFTYDPDPLFSGLVFEADSVQGVDILHAHEIFRLPLRAGLVVLSACNTGQGQLVKGEGVMSLGRAFRAAGSPTLLMSLWQVNDASTSRLMTAFHQQLNDSKPASEAIREARKTFFAQSSLQEAHPRNWAAFVLLGEDVRFGSEWQLWRMVFLGILAGILVLGLWPEVINFNRFRGS